MSAVFVRTASLQSGVGGGGGGGGGLVGVKSLTNRWHVFIPV